MNSRQALPENHAPSRFVLWHPPTGSVVEVGPEQLPVVLPEYPLPILRAGFDSEVPDTVQIGQGVYDYLRQFPECPGNSLYAGLLRDAFPHYLADLAAHAVMLDAKDVEPAYVLRKLTCLKILRLAEPANADLLRQLCRGYFELALDFAELANTRRHLLEAMRFGQELLRLDPDDLQALNVLAEVDLLFGDLPAAIDKLRRLQVLLADAAAAGQVGARLAELVQREYVEVTLVDELESVAEAIRLHLAGDDHAAIAVLEWIEEQGRLPKELPSANFYCLLAYCRRGCADLPGAMVALHKALDIEPGHPAALAALADTGGLP